MREIEIKIKVGDVAALEKRLQDLGCQLSDPISQRDVVYSKAGEVSAWQEPSPGDVVLRLRYLENTTEFNLKQQQTTEMDNLEYETEVTNPEAMHNILTTLGYAPQVEVKKLRRKGKLGRYEICVDQVETLGGYMEIESLIADNASPDGVKEELYALAEKLGLSRTDEEIRAYDTQIFHQTHR